MNLFFSRHSFKIIVLVIFLLPVLSRGARLAMTSNDNKVEDWLPKEYPETQHLKWFKQHFENETFILASWIGCTLDDPRLELLEAKLLTHVNKIYPKPRTLIQAGWQKLFPPAQPPEPVIGPPMFQSIETGRTMLARLTEGTSKLSEEEASRRLAGLFVGREDPNQTCAIISLTDEGKRDLRAHTRRTLRNLQRRPRLAPRPGQAGRAAGRQCRDQHRRRTDAGATVRAGGHRGPVPGLLVPAEHAFDDDGLCHRALRRRDQPVDRVLFRQRHERHPVDHARGGLCGRHFRRHPFRQLLSRFGGGRGRRGAPARAVHHAWIPCTLSAITSAAGLASLYTSELIPIRLFGVYTALGVLTTLGLLFLFLPAWMQLWPMKKDSALDGGIPKIEDLALPVRWRRILSGVLTHWGLVFTAGAALMMFCAVGLTRINTSIKLTKLFSSDAEIIKNYEWLEKNLGPLVPMEVVLKIDNSQCKLTMLERMELVDRIQAGLKEIREVGNTLSAVTFAPSLEIKRMGPLVSKASARGIWNKRLEAHRDEYIDGGFLAEDDHFELWRISTRVEALNDVDYGMFLNDLRAKVEPVLVAERTRILNQRAKMAHQPIDAEAVAAAVQPTAADEQPLGIGAVYTGLVPVVYKAQREMLIGLGWNFITDLLTIAAVMTVVFRDLSAGLILLVPSVFPVVIVFGLMGWFGVTIDVGTIMTPTVALGVSVDDVVHFLIWYRRGLSEGKSRRNSIMLAYEGCARAMYQSWAVLGLGLAVFALSSFVPTQRFGAMMFCLLTAALLGNLLMMPTVLASPVSALFGRRLIRKAKAAAAQSAAVSPADEAFGQAPSGPHATVPAPMGHDSPHRSVRS